MYTWGNTLLRYSSVNNPLSLAFGDVIMPSPLFSVIIAALQHYLKEITMFDFDKQVKEVTAQVKKYNDMWINWTITVLEQLKK
jgi:hypothetical protein